MRKRQVTGQDRYLQRTDMVQSDDASIRNNAHQVTASATTEAEAVNAIMDFVRRQLPDPSGTTPADAVSSLNSNSGNCKNRATLTFDGQPFKAETQGAFTIAAANGTHTLAVTAPGYGSASLTMLVAGADVIQNVRLSQVTGNGTAKPSGTTPGFELITALAGLLIIALYRHGRA